MTNRTCSIDGCDRQHRARGWCNAHLTRWYATGDPGPVEIKFNGEHYDALTCSAPACEQPPSTRGLCSNHYYRWRKYGDPEAGPPIKRVRTGCQVDGCEGRHFGHGYCQKHRYRWAEHGDPLVTRPNPRDSGPAHVSWLGDDIEYDGAHRRVKVAYGPARTHNCLRCGEQAIDWAYLNNDSLSEKLSVRRLRYSTNADDYIPMCKHCHRQFDYHKDDWRPTPEAINAWRRSLASRSEPA